MGISDLRDYIMRNWDDIVAFGDTYTDFTMVKDRDGGKIAELQLQKLVAVLDEGLHLTGMITPMISLDDDTGVDLERPLEWLDWTRGPQEETEDEDTNDDEEDAV